jgi:hypothetical protein
MEIKVNKDVNTQVIFDTCGNVYFICNKKLYDINIDGKNNLTCEETKLELCKPSKDLQIYKGKIKLTNNMNSLKGKVFKEYMKELEKLKEEDYDINEDENEEEFVKTQQYFPEDFEYFESFDKQVQEDIYEDFDSMYTGDNQYFVFLSEVNTKNELPILEGDDSNALYETLIYNKDISSGDLIHKSKFIGGSPIYRLRLYQSGEIAFRPIGEREKYYKFSLVNDNLQIIQVNENKLVEKDSGNKSNLVVKNLTLGQNN